MKSWILGILTLFIVIFFCFLAWQNIDQPPSLNFDEHHYIPAAKVFLNDAPLVNLEHPPLGKELISIGLKTFGDNPQGWRSMSVLFGALTLAGLFIWSFILFNSISTSLFVVTITTVNHFLFVQSRIAMLDTFMTAFLIWAAVCFSYWWKNVSKKWFLSLSGLLLGLALATKLFTLIPIAALGLLVLKQSYENKKLDLVFIFSGSLTLAYLICYIPMVMHYGASWSDWPSWQLELWNGQQRVSGTHPYQSSWWTWPVQLRPMWYHFVQSADKSTFQGVVLIGNPIILWTGLLSMIFCLWSAVKRKDSSAKQIALAYALGLLSWAIIPRELTFFYYYYPAALILSLSLAYLFNESRILLKNYFEISRWVFASLCIWCFIYFYPILSGIETTSEKLNSWMWFSSWI